MDEIFLRLFFKYNLNCNRGSRYTNTYFYRWYEIFAFYSRADSILENLLHEIFLALHVVDKIEFLLQNIF